MAEETCRVRARLACVGSAQLDSTRRRSAAVEHDAHVPTQVHRDNALHEIAAAASLYLLTIIVIVGEVGRGYSRSAARRGGPWCACCGTAVRRCGGEVVRCRWRDGEVRARDVCAPRSNLALIS